MANDRTDTHQPQVPDDKISRQAWLALSVATLTTFLVVIDISAVNVAFPSIQDDFEVSRTSLSWVVSSYNIVVGALLLSAGRLADSVGRIAPGLAADLLILATDDYRDLVYHAGSPLIAAVFQGGERVV